MIRINAGSLDLVEEIRLRRWAREHYVPAAERNPDWHPVVLQEMQCKEQELEEAAGYSMVSQIVPLHPGSFSVVHEAHAEVPRSNLLLKVPEVSECTATDAG